jgi:hypothetical protein
MIKYICDYCKTEYRNSLPEHSINMNCQVSNQRQIHRNLKNYNTHICEACIFIITDKFNHFCDTLGLGDVNGKKMYE